MAFGIVEPRTAIRPQGTELLVDDEKNTFAQQEEHVNFKYGKGKVCIWASI
jgi:hypothetical protein